MAKTIPLTQGYETIVDDDDYEMLRGLAEEGKAPRSWRILITDRKHRKKYYANGWYPKKDREKRRSVLLHRLLMNPDNGLLVDHRDGNGLNNQRNNLRLATNAQNQQNSDGRPRKARFKGLSFQPASSKCNPWQAYIQVNKKKINLGYFPTEIEAALAYNEAAKKHFGEFALLNEIPQEKNE